MKKKHHSIARDTIRQMFSALGDPTRYRIFHLLLKKDDLCVSEVASALDISVPAASQHFRILEMSGLVEPTRHGQMVCYVIKKKDPFIQSLIHFIKKGPST